MKPCCQMSPRPLQAGLAGATDGGQARDPLQQIPLIPSIVRRCGIRKVTQEADDPGDQDRTVSYDGWLKLAIDKSGPRRSRTHRFIRTVCS